jgi:cell fate regulator YaaT (PSP1 superfamily)
MASDRVVLVRLLDVERESTYFRAGDVPVQVGAHCVVDHGGLLLGLVVEEVAAGLDLSDQLEPVLRLATEADIESHRYNQADAERTLKATRATVARHELPMHLVAAEYSLDRRLLRVFFTAPHRVDFRELLRDLASQFGTRIELRQMGHRDETKLRGGYGRCGVEVCCHRFLREPKPVPMEYAYDQELFVSPERITGMCGRLMCCLAYEREAYIAELAQLPKLGSQIMVGEKRGKVISHSIFRQTVTVLTEDRDRIEVDIADVTPPGSPKKAT